MSAQLSEDDGAHGLAFCEFGALPEEAESLLADGALNVFLFYGRLKQNLHECVFRVSIWLEPFSGVPSLTGQRGGGSLKDGRTLR